VAGAEFQVRTKKKIARIDVTKEVERAAKELRAKSGALLVSVPHTTAAVTVGETWDEDVVTDMERALAAWVPDIRFDHAEGNSPAHSSRSRSGSPVSCRSRTASPSSVAGRGSC
jgi:secondary thiamine-phosphate synthase enzyme